MEHVFLQEDLMCYIALCCIPTLHGITVSHVRGFMLPICIVSCPVMSLMCRSAAISCNFIFFSSIFADYYDVRSSRTYHTLNALLSFLTSICLFAAALFSWFCLFVSCYNCCFCPLQKLLVQNVVQLWNLHLRILRK